MPIYCTALKPRQLRSGRRLRLRFLEPRCWEIVKRAMAPGGTRRFAAVSGGVAGRRGDEIAAGAKGRLCEILENTEGDDGICNVIVETGTACRVLNVRKEEMHRGPPLIIGELEELEEEEPETQQDGSEDGSEDEAVVLGEEEQLELLRERVQLLELLNAAMELEQARLEQRRLELTMLLSQRRLYQELIEMRSEVADLVGLTAAVNTPVPQTRLVRHRSAEETSGASGSSEQWRPSQESRSRTSVAQLRESPTQRTSEDSSASRLQAHGLLARLDQAERTRTSTGSLQRLASAAEGTTGDVDFRTYPSPARGDGLARSMANALSQTGYRASRAASAVAEQEGPQRSRQASRNSTSSHTERGSIQAEAIRRRGSGNADFSLTGGRTSLRGGANHSGANASFRGTQPRGGRGPTS